MLRFTAVVCTYKRYDVLPGAIGSLLEQADIGGFDIIVVDNSPDRAVAEEFAAKYKNNKLIAFIYEDKSGLSNARNVGANAARGDIVAYIDDDALASPAWARSLVEAFASFGENVGIVGGPVEALWSAPPPKWLSRRSLDMLSVLDWGPVAREMEPEEWLTGCNIAFRRVALLEAGGFPTNLGRGDDDTLLLSNEEYALCDRLVKGGRTMVYAPGAHVRHRIKPHRVSVRWLVKRMAWQAISDAVSHPAESARHAAWKKWHPASRLARAFRSVRFLWIMSGWKRSLSDDELEIVYDTFNAYICGRD